MKYYPNEWNPFGVSNSEAYDPFDFMRSFFGANTQTAMRTDVKESDKGYIMDVEMPGYNKEDIDMTLDNGYLTVSAKHCQSCDEKQKDAGFVKQERFASCSRTYYVGEIDESQVTAEYTNGILHLDLPKATPQNGTKKIKIR